MKKHFTLFTAISLFAISHSAFSQTTVTFQPGAAGKDAYIDDINVNLNQGNLDEFNALAWTQQGNPLRERSLIEFDLTSIPTNATIQSATLTLYNNPTSSNGLLNGEHSHLSGSDASILQRITSAWSESTVTWNNQPGTSAVNAATLPQDVTPHEDYAIDVTLMTQDMVTNPSTNFGFMLQLITEQYYRCLLFASSDHANAALHPKLVVTYTVPSSCISLVLQPNAANGKDAYIDDINVNLNQGNIDEFNALAWTVNGNPLRERSLIEFDLTAVPANAVVQSATLTLYNNPTSSNGFLNGEHSHFSGSDASYLLRVTAPWSENTVTWNNQPATTLTNAVTLPQDVNPHQNYVIDVTTMTQNMVTNPSTNYGFMLQLITEQYYRCLLFASSDHADSTLHPKLELCYTVPNPCISLVLQPNATAGKDAYIDDINVNLNQGNIDEFNSLAWTVNGNPIRERSLIEYDLTSIPTNATVQSATLTLYNNPTSSNGFLNGEHSHFSGSDASYLLRVTAPWSESTVTWNNQPATTLTNAITLPQDISPHEDYVIDVTNAVQDMVTNPSTNYGFMLQLITEQYYRCLLFASSDHADSTLHPKLEICYTMPCTSLILQPDSSGKDAYIDDIYSNLNQGTIDEFNALAWTVNGNPLRERSMVEFDLTAVPTTATVQSASLTLYNNPTSSNGFLNGEHSHFSGSNASYLLRITAPWNENTVTWNNQPSTTFLNAVTLPQDVNPHQDYVIDVTAMVQDMVTNPSTNYGFMLQLITEQYYRCMLFASSDHANAALHPKLEICYTVSSSLSVISTNTNPPCNGGCNGTATAFPSNGTPPYTYSWSPVSASTQTVSALCSGNYTVTVTDATNNTVTTVVTINQPTPLTLSVNSVDASCSTCNDGYAWAAGNGGTPPYNYEWGTVPIQNTDTAHNLVPGSYYVCVDDANHCKTCSTIVVSYTVGINTIAGESSGFSVNPNPSNGNFEITFKNGIQNVDVEVYDAIGKLVFNEALSNRSNRMRLNLEAAPGIYFLNVIADGRRFIKKIVIQ
jgi:hypothetical protein